MRLVISHMILFFKKLHTKPCLQGNDQIVIDKWGIIGHMTDFQNSPLDVINNDKHQ